MTPVGFFSVPPRLHWLCTDSSAARRLSNAFADFWPDACLLRQNAHVPALIEPTVPVVGVLEIVFCTPSKSLPPLPVPSPHSMIPSNSMAELTPFLSFFLTTSSLRLATALRRSSRSEKTTEPAKILW